jgi:hypothetical protein
MIADAHLRNDSVDRAARILAEADREMRVGEERWYASEVFRLQGEVARAMGDTPDLIRADEMIERCFV